AERRDEDVVVPRRRALLDRVGLRAGGVGCSHEPLRERRRCRSLVLTAAARDEADRHESCKEWNDEAHGVPILRSAAAADKLLVSSGRKTCFFLLGSLFAPLYLARVRAMVALHVALGITVIVVCFASALLGFLAYRRAGTGGAFVSHALAL